MSSKKSREGVVYSDLATRTVAVTGGANGIGAAMVRRFAEQGSRVFFCDVDDKTGRKLANKLGERVEFSPVDLRQQKEVQIWIDSIAIAGKGIHCLINNAAQDPRIPLQDLTLEQWDELIAINLRAFMLTIRYAAKHMRAGASVVNLSSITCHTAPAEMSAYVATKSGIIGLTRSLARELGARKIRVNTLSPGWTMTKRQLATHVTPAVKKMLKAEQCIGVLLQPDDIAEVALFLASDVSRAITGQELLADRGSRYH